MLAQRMGRSPACLLLRFVEYALEEQGDLNFFHPAQLAESGVLLMQQVVSVIMMRVFKELAVSGADGQLQLLSLCLSGVKQLLAVNDTYSTQNRVTLTRLKPM